MDDKKDQEDKRFENDLVVGVPVNDKVLIGSYVIIPKSEVETPFDLSESEWIDTKRMIDTIKDYIDEKYKPDGYNMGWNCGKVAGQEVFYSHLHIIPRFKDELYAGKGIRHWLKKEENKRLASTIK